MDKKNIRKNILSLRNRVKNRGEKNEKIFKNLLSLKQIKDCKSIFIYVSFDNEIETFNLINWCLLNNKKVYVPRITKEKGIMEAVSINSLEGLAKNKLGILEPVNGDIIDNVNNIDVVVLPGAAFDLNGGRIGYGGGYYDRYLKEYKNCIVSLTYEIQILNDIPVEEHDISVNILVSEKNIYLI